MFSSEGHFFGKKARENPLSLYVCVYVYVRGCCICAPAMGDGGDDGLYLLPLFEKIICGGFGGEKTRTLSEHLGHIGYGKGKRKSIHGSIT